MFHIQGSNGVIRQITRRADNFIRLLGELSIVYPQHRIDYIG
jgi:hypothetical protein